MSLLPSRKHRRRRRRHSSSALQRTPEQLRQGPQRRRVGLAELAACAAVTVICGALIGLIWINAERAAREQANDTRGRVEAVVTAQAAILAEEARRELAAIDQSLTILQSAWNTNPEKFELATWRNLLPVLTEVADDLFVANDKRIIVQDIIPQAVGQGIGSAYANFANGSLGPVVRDGPRDRDNRMLIGELGEGGVTRQYLMYLIRPLAQPQGWLIGASFRSTALTKLFAEAKLGKHGIAALIDTKRGGVQAVAGTAALRPKLGLANTPLYAAIQARPDSGIWIGPTAIDGVERIQAFHRVPGRDLVVLVGMATNEAMVPADNWAIGARSLALGATLLVLAIGATVLWELWHWRRIRRRQRALNQAQSMLDATQTDLAALRVQSTVQAAQLQSILAATVDGVAVIDATQRLAACNPRFAVLSGLDAAALPAGLPLDELVRLLARAERFGRLDDLEAEVARRGALLQSAPTVETSLLMPDGATIPLHASNNPDGGLVLVLHGAAFAPAHTPFMPPVATEEV